jgi:hypothetical protein
MALRGPGAEQAVLALAADAADVVVALAHLGDQLVDFLGRVLQVGIERDDDLAAAMLEAGHDRHVLAGVGGEEHHARDVGPGLELLAQDRRRAVAAAVVDEDDLVAFGRGRRAPDRAGRTSVARPASSL